MCSLPRYTPGNVGMNCTHRDNITPLLKSLEEANLSHVPVIIYPNGGEDYSEPGYFRRRLVRSIRLGDVLLCFAGRLLSHLKRGRLWLNWRSSGWTSTTASSAWADAATTTRKISNSFTGRCIPSLNEDDSPQSNVFLFFFVVAFPFSRFSIVMYVSLQRQMHAGIIQIIPTVTDFLFFLNSRM